MQYKVSDTGEKYRVEAGARTCDDPHDSGPLPTLVMS